jgi:hypothetical protein
MPAESILQQNSEHVGFEVLTAVNSDVTPCSLVAVCLFIASCFLGLLFDPEYRGGTFLRNVSQLLPDYASQKIVLFNENF